MRQLRQLTGIHHLRTLHIEPHQISTLRDQTVMSTTITHSHDYYDDTAEMTAVVDSNVCV